MANRFVACIFIILASCQSARKITATPKMVHNELCAEEWLRFPDQPHPMWEEVKTSAVNFPAGFTKPLKYKAYKVITDSLRQFFYAVKDRNSEMSHLAIILPVHETCEAFGMYVSGAMSPALQAKYPNLISLQGNGINNKAADLRLDWDGFVAKGQIMYNGSVYFLMPVNGGNNDISYLIYNKDDAGELKQPFEETPAGRQSAPQMRTIEKTYDR